MCANCCKAFTDAKLYCIMCQMSLTQDDEVIDPKHMSKASGFKKYASAAFDKERGEIIGWDAVYAVLDQQG